MLYVYCFGIAGLIRIRWHGSSLVAAAYQFLQCALRRAQAGYLSECEDEDQVEEEFGRSGAAQRDPHRSRYSELQRLLLFSTAACNTLHYAAWLFGLARP